MIKKTLILIILLYVVYIPSAHAYLDPGAGSMVIQIVIGAVTALLFAVRTYWQKLKGLFTRKNGCQGPPKDVR